MRGCDALILQAAGVQPERATAQMYAPRVAVGSRRVRGCTERVFGTNSPTRQNNRFWNRHAWCCGFQSCRQGILPSSNSRHMWWRNWRERPVSGRVTITPTTLSIALGVKRVELVEPRGVAGMDANKSEHVLADTDGNIRRIPNEALGYAQERREKHHTLGVTGGKPKNKHGRRKGSNGVKHPGVKPKNKGRKAESSNRKAESDNKRVKKRRDDRVNMRERARINTRFSDKKNDWLPQDNASTRVSVHGIGPRRSNHRSTVAKVKQAHVQGDARLAKDGPQSGDRMGNCNCSVRQIWVARDWHTPLGYEFHVPHVW